MGRFRHLHATSNSCRTAGDVCFLYESDVLIRTRCFLQSWKFLYSICAFALLISECGFVQEEDDNVVIVVGSRHVTLDELKKDMAFMGGELDVPEPHGEQIRNRLAEKIIGYYLILEYGKENGISIEEEEVKSALADVHREYAGSDFRNALLREYMDFDQWRGRFEEQLLAKKILEMASGNIIPPAYRDIERYYEAHGGEFRFPQMVRFRQILTQSKAEAEDLLRRIKDGEDMGDLAREYSAAPEAEQGGEVGWVASEHLDESMAKVLFSMSPGEVSPITKTSYGYHIFEMLSVRPPGLKPLPEVVAQIEATLLDQKRKLFLKEWLSHLRTHFDVQVNQALLSELEL